MALSRRSVQRVSGSIWPGFVDAMTALLLVLMFVLTIFMIVQFMLSETITGQESELDELTSEVNALARALGLEQQRSFSLDEQVSVLGTTLQDARDKAETQSVLIASLTDQISTQAAELTSRAEAISSFEVQMAVLLAQRDEARDLGSALAESNAALEANKENLLKEQDALQLALALARDEIDAQTEIARLAAARRQALDVLISDLRNRVSSSNTSLADALARLENSQQQVESLNSDVTGITKSLSDRDAALVVLRTSLADLTKELSEAESARLAESVEASDIRARLADAIADLSDTEKARLAEAAAAQVLRDRLDQADAQLTEAEKVRLAEVAAAQALREKLANADDELTAMTLALEEQRRKAEEMLTMIAAAQSAESGLTDKLAAALLAGEELQQQVLGAKDIQSDTAARLAQVETALAAALLARDQLAGRLLSEEEARQEAVSRLGSVEMALAKSQAAQDDLRSGLQEQLLSGDSLQARLSAVEIALVEMRAERDHLQETLTATNSSQTQIAGQLATTKTALASAMAEVESLRGGLVDEAELRKQLAAALAAKLAAEQDAETQLSTSEQRSALLSVANLELQKEEAKSADSLRRMAVLNEQIAALRGQLGSLQALLDVAEDADKASQIEITNLSSRLNTALARAVSEERLRAELETAERKRLEIEAKRLENYRSEFFGKMRSVLGDREGVRIVGDRFVFSSEVLFEPASVDLADDGQVQIARVAEILAEVSSAIPPEIDWVIRVDGHTDNTALSGGGRYRDNWELSQARALSVVRFMIDDLGFPAGRLAATGFGEFQPVAFGETPEDLARNRRIELKLTER